MRRSRMLFAAMILFLLSGATMAEKANAGVFDRIKDIYEAPDRLDELKESYDAGIKAVEGQLEESRRQAEQLLQRQTELEQSNEAIRAQNEAYQAQNAALAEQNEQLIQQMDKLEQSRQALYRKAVVAAGALVALIAAYALSVRIWRYLTWRRQGRDHRRQADDGGGVTLS